MAKNALTIQILTDAKRLLEKHGHNKFGYQSSFGALCVRGALRKAAHREVHVIDRNEPVYPAYKEADELLYRAITGEDPTTAERWGDAEEIRAITLWNDEDERILPEVIEAIERALVLAH